MRYISRPNLFAASVILAAFHSAAVAGGAAKIGSQIAADAQNLKCDVQLNNFANTGLFTAHAGEVYRNPMFANINFMGEKPAIVTYLLGEPYVAFEKAVTREDLDREWRRMLERFDYATQKQGDAELDAKWIYAARDAYMFHACVIKSRYGVDFLEEARVKRESARSAKVNIEAETASLVRTPNATIYSCDFSNFPTSKETGSLIYVFRNDGSGTVRWNGKSRDSGSPTTCRSGDFSWAALGDRKLLKFGRDEFSRACVATYSNQMTTLFTEKTTLRPEQFLASEWSASDYYGTRPWAPTSARMPRDEYKCVRSVAGEVGAP